MLVGVVLLHLHVCTLVKTYRAQGYTDQQIEEGARARGVPDTVIRWARAHC